MKSLPQILLSIALGCALLNNCHAANGSIRVVASDLFSGTMVSTLEAFAANNLDTPLRINLSGSLDALEALDSDKADLAIVAIPENAMPLSTDYTLVPFTFIVTVVVVSDLNPLTEINFSQLQGIYADSEEFSYTRWGELDSSEVWENRLIQPLALKQPGNLAFEMFCTLALNRISLKSNVTLATNKEALRELMLNDPSMIAVVDRIPDLKSVRSLSIVPSETEAVGFDPTSDNVFYGDYPLRLPIYLVFETEKKLLLRPYLSFLFSDRVIDQLQSEGFMKLSKNLIKSTLDELDILTEN